MASTQEYANLSEHVYDTKIPVGVNPIGKDKTIDIGGHEYKILEHASNLKNGYQGTIYQDVNSGEIIVAHRGTESPTDAKVDAIMINSRTNIQAEDAIALTKRAQEYAREQHEINPKFNPTITVTGHSLGGTLAQITAHHYGLSGEAFNPYGSASLDRHIPVGQGHFTNHVIAGDAVSAASPHYGQTRVYASAIDAIALETHDKARGVRGSTLTTASALVGDHFMGNFTGHDGTNNILNDRQAGLRATQHWPAIEHYREDVSNNRQIAMVAFISPQGIVNLIDEYTPKKQPNQSTPVPTSWDVNPRLRSDASDILTPAQQMQHDWTYNLVAQNPRFDNFTDPQKSTIAYGIIRQIADSGQDINKLQLVTLAPDGVTVAAKLDSPVGMLSLPLKEALQTAPQDVVLAQTDLGERNHTAAMLREQQQSQSRGMSIS